MNIYIGTMVSVLVNGLGDRGSFPGQDSKKCLTLSIIRYASRVSGRIQGKELHPPLNLGVVAIEKGAFESPNYIYIYIERKRKREREK